MTIHTQKEDNHDLQLKKTQNIIQHIKLTF